MVHFTKIDGDRIMNLNTAAPAVLNLGKMIQTVHSPNYFFSTEIHIFSCNLYVGRWVAKKGDGWLSREMGG
jgi:hypothetical protein